MRTCRCVTSHQSSTRSPVPWRSRRSSTTPNGCSSPGARWPMPRFCAAQVGRSWFRSPKATRARPTPLASIADKGGRLRGHHDLLSPRPRRGAQSSPAERPPRLSKSDSRLDHWGVRIPAGHRPRGPAADRGLLRFGRSDDHRSRRLRHTLRDTDRAAASGNHVLHSLGGIRHG